MRVGSVIDRRARNVTLERKGSGSFNADGDWVPSANDPVTIRASIQPAAATMLANKAEGIQAETRKIMWTREVLREDDVILDGAYRYRILDVESWQADGGYSVGYLGSLGDTP
jgi:hypothetical protein